MEAVFNFVRKLPASRIGGSTVPRAILVEYSVYLIYPLEFTDSSGFNFAMMYILEALHGSFCAHNVLGVSIGACMPP